jgi:hypothetical protein
VAQPGIVGESFKGPADLKCQHNLVLAIFGVSSGLPSTDVRRCVNVRARDMRGGKRVEGIRQCVKVRQCVDSLDNFEREQMDECRDYPGELASRLLKSRGPYSSSRKNLDAPRYRGLANMSA